MEGISIVVGCGYGRGLRLRSEHKVPENWRFQSLSAHDLITLSWLQDFDALSVWRILDAVDAIHAEGVSSKYKRVLKSSGVVPGT